MPLSTFDGEPTEELHEHYDAEGNLTGSTVVTRPGWSDDDRAWALGLALREANQCPHGHDLSESTDYDYRWVPEPPIVCLACVALEAAAKANAKHPQHRAMLYRLNKRPRPKPNKKRRG